jgi:hypothetical protein
MVRHAEAPRQPLPSVTQRPPARIDRDLSALSRWSCRSKARRRCGPNADSRVPTTPARMSELLKRLVVDCDGLGWPSGMDDTVVPERRSMAAIVFADADHGVVIGVAWPSGMHRRELKSRPLGIKSGPLVVRIALARRSNERASRSTSDRRTEIRPSTSA